MIIGKTNKIQIRNYLKTDADKIGAFDRILELSYRYNPDFIITKPKPPHFRELSGV